MKLAVLGGSFNPPHLGHLILADCVCRELGYDRVLFIPCSEPPHKTMADAASPSDRLTMVKRAVKGDRRFKAEDFEIKAGGTSYTWDTVCYLEEKYKGKLEGKIGLVFGFDLASHFEYWKNSGQLAQKCELILAVRSSDYVKNSCVAAVNTAKGDFNTPKDGFTEKDFAFPHVKLYNPELEISSSDIRERITSGKGWRYLVSDGVFEYIKKKGLYGYKKS